MAKIYLSYFDYALLYNRLFKIHEWFAHKQYIVTDSKLVNYVNTHLENTLCIFELTYMINLNEFRCSTDFNKREITKDIVNDVSSSIVLTERNSVGAMKSYAELYKINSMLQLKNLGKACEKSEHIEYFNSVLNDYENIHKANNTSVYGKLNSNNNSSDYRSFLDKHNANAWNVFNHPEFRKLVGIKDTRKLVTKEEIIKLHSVFTKAVEDKYEELGYSSECENPYVTINNEIYLIGDEYIHEQCILKSIYKIIIDRLSEYAMGIPEGISDRVLKFKKLIENPSKALLFSDFGIDINKVIKICENPVTSEDDLEYLVNINNVLSSIVYILKPSEICDLYLNVEGSLSNIELEW